MTRRLRSVLLAVQDTAHDIRPEGFVRLGPVYFTTFQRHFDAVKNGFDMGRDYERGQIKRLAGRVDRCEALLRGSSTATSLRGPSRWSRSHRHKPNALRRVSAEGIRVVLPRLDPPESPCSGDNNRNATGRLSTVE